VETGSGPYASAPEFYANYPVALRRSISNRDQQVGGQDDLLQAFRSLAVSLPSGASDSAPGFGFGLANHDLNPNNFLVDSQFNVLAIID
jgi:hypothetical protein